MSASGYTPILVYGSTTPGNTPLAANLTTSASGVELAINAADGKLYYKDSGGVVQVLASKDGNVNVSSLSFGTTGLTPNTATTGAITVAGTLVAANGGTGQSSYTTGDLLYATGSTALSKLGIGTSGRYLSSSGTAPQWTAPAALTKTDDTNVTLTLGGSASTALLNAASLTLGWTGQLATSRGGTGLSSFTTNGVVYASSSSALTTGSALVYDGSIFYVNGAGGTRTSDAASANGFEVVPGSTNNVLSYNRTSATYLDVRWRAGNQIWEVANTEQMRLTSTGLGIGTSSPAYKLDVSGQGRVTESGTGSGDGGFISNTGSANGNAGLLFQTNSTSRWNLTTQGTNGANLRIYNYTLGATVATFDSSGNLGLGVTPSAWTAYKAIQINTRGAVSASADTANLSCNWYYDGASKYISSGYATLFQEYNGAFYWLTAPSGTAGNAISFTQAMTLDASGSLVIGGTNALNSLTKLTLTDGTITSVSGYFTGGVSYTGTTSNHPLAFLTNNAERARIDSSGDFGLGTSAGTGTRTLTIQTNTSGNPTLNLTAAGADLGSLWFERSTVRLYARASNAGGVYLASSGTSWTAVSDERKKDIIEPITDAASKVSTLRAVIGKYKDDSKQKRRSFLIAQDVQAVLPEAVDASNPDELGLSYSDTIPLLVAAIKELNAKVQSLEAQLKGK